MGLEYKFNQNIIIKEVISSSLPCYGECMGDPIHIKDGCCFVLSAIWIKEFLNGNIDSCLSKINDSETSCFNNKKKIASLTHKYYKSLVEFNTETDLCEDRNLNFLMLFFGEGFDVIKLENMEKLKQEFKAMIIGLDFKFSGEKHAIVSIKQDNKIYYFEPNNGVYIFDKEKEFEDTIFNIYGDNFKAEFFAVKKK